MPILFGLLILYPQPTTRSASEASCRTTRRTASRSKTESFKSSWLSENTTTYHNLLILTVLDNHGYLVVGKLNFVGSWLALFISERDELDTQIVPNRLLTTAQLDNHGSIISGWWYTYPSEKYEFVSGIIIPNIWKNKNIPNHQPVFYLSDFPTLQKTMSGTWLFHGFSIWFSWDARHRR